MENIFVEFLPPWVETGIQPAFYDKESGTVLQQTARMYARVNMLIRMFNKLSKETKETVEEYITKFNELHDYVHDYFANLDVQEEINNKLDAMVEAGTLQEIITEYIQANTAWCFDNVADMKLAENYVNGSYAQTLGYYAKNDGGKAIYKIRTITNEDTVDETFIYQITNSDDLVAELIVDESMNVKQFGVKADGTTDNYDKLYTVLNKGVKKLYFPNGEYVVNTSLAIDNCKTITGESMRDTVIKAPDGFVTWSTGNNQRAISNLTIDGVSADNNIGIQGILAFSELSNLAIKNYETAINTLEGTWINKFSNLYINYCTNGLIHTGDNFNNIGLYNCYFQHLTLGVDFKGSTVKFFECNFENITIVAKTTGRNIVYDNCYIEGNTNLLYVDRSSYTSNIKFVDCWIYGNSTASGWLANLYCAASTDTETASLYFENCVITAASATYAPFAFNGTSNKTYWGINLKNNRYSNMPSADTYKIYFDELVDRTNCTNYLYPGNPLTVDIDIPMYTENGIEWYRHSKGNARGANRTNTTIAMKGRYAIEKTSGSITITPTKRYGCFYPEIQDGIPVIVKFSDGSMSLARMNVSQSAFSIGSIDYNSRTTESLIFDCEYGIVH